jgi:predicted LPLAT superfamily acyltransferase
MNTRHWTSLAERGSALGLRLTEACYRLLGERAARMLLVPVVAYFLVVAGEARQSSFGYFRRLQRFGGSATGLPRPGWRTSFRHMLAFAESALQKLGAWMQRIDPASIDFPQRSALDDLLRSGRGALLLSAHVGNIEMLRALAVARGLTTVNAVVYTRHAARFKRIL